MSFVKSTDEVRNFAPDASSESSERFLKGAAFVNGQYVPVSQAAVSVLDWGFTRSDVTYDVVHVWEGAFFRLDDHLERFAKSLKATRLSSPWDSNQMAHIAARCVVLSGLRNAYVALVCTRGRPRIFGSRRPQDCENTFIAYAIPWIDVIPLEVQARGAHLHVGTTPRASRASLDPTVKSYQWGDFTRALFEAHDAGFDTAVLLDEDGFVTEGPGFNVFTVKDGKVATPDRGVLEGITRRSVLELCESVDIPATISPLRIADLNAADEIFCATTAGGIMPVSRIGGQLLSGDRPGPLSERLKALYWTRHRQGWNARAVNYDDAEHPLGSLNG